MTFIPLNTQNSLGANFNSVNDVLRVLNSKRSFKVLKVGSVTIPELTITSGALASAEASVTETHNLGFAPYVMAFYDLSTIFYPFVNDSRIENTAVSGGAITNLLLYIKNITVGDTSIGFAQSYQSIGASATSAFTAYHASFKVAYVLFQEKLVTQ